MTTQVPLAYDGRSSYAIDDWVDEGSKSTSDTAKERSYVSCPDMVACFNSVHTEKVIDYAWRPVTDSKLLGFLCGVVHKKISWFSYENGQALVSHRAKAFRSPEPTFKVKDYPTQFPSS